jgi:hypothetical protein
MPIFRSANMGLKKHLLVSVGVGALLVLGLAACSSASPGTTGSGGTAPSPGSSQTNLRPQSGSGAVIYIHQTTSANTSGSQTTLDNTVTNDHLNVLIEVTPNRSPDGTSAVVDAHPIGVRWGGAKWHIFNEDGASMPIGAAFNVYALPLGGFSGVFVQKATTTNTFGYYTVMNDPTLNTQPNALLLVTSNWNPSGGAGVTDAHPLGVRYHGTQWDIFHTDHTPIAKGASYNVVVITGVTQAFIQQANSGNISGKLTQMSQPYLDGNPAAIVFITQDLTTGGTVDNDSAGVIYKAGKWSIYNEHHPMPVGASFIVMSV